MALDWGAWQGFVEELRAAERELGFQPGEERFYRGHNRSRWTLLPLLMRDYRDPRTRDWVEASLFFEFQARARELHHLPLSDWDVLFFMRHHGVATRLLDWTEVLGVAMYFALADGQDPCVWVLNPYRMNEDEGWGRDLVAPKNLGWDAKQREMFDYGDLLLEPDAWPWKGPLAIYPQQKPARMGAQRGWFTIHGEDPRPLEQQVGSCLRRVAISPGAAEVARTLFEIFGVDPYGIYADLDGLSKALRLKHAVFRDGTVTARPGVSLERTASARRRPSRAATPRRAGPRRPR